MSEPEDIDDDDDLYEDDEDRDDMVEECERLIAAIPKHIPDAKIEVDGQLLSADEIVAQLQAYLDAVTATNEARAKYEAALQAAEESNEALEAALRDYHANNGPEDKN